MPPATLIPAWTADQSAAFNRRPLKFAHRLAETGLFDDAALARLLDSWPTDLCDINLFDFDASGNAVMRTGVRGNTPGAQIIEGIREGRMWLQLREIGLHDPDVGAAMRGAISGVAEQVRGFKPIAANGALIISAPGAKVPFHADAPGVMLFHLRGRKRLWVYPADERHLAQHRMEDIVLKQTTEDLPYNRAMDVGAQMFDLTPGDALTWPLHAPHRVENLEGLNVSLSVDFLTWGSRLLNGALYSAGVMRRLGVPAPRLAKAPGALHAGLWAAHLGLRRMNLVKDRLAGIERSFELNEEGLRA